MLWQLWAIFAFATAAVAAYRWWRKFSFRLDFPVVGSSDDQNLAYAVYEGHQKYPDTPFIVPADPPRVILPMNLYQEVIHADDADFSFRAELYDVFLGRFTHIGEDARDVIDAVRLDLTRNLNGVLQPIQDEASHALAELVPESTEWTTLALQKTVLRMVGLMSGRVFVGLPLSRDEEWLAASVNFTVDVSRSRLGMLRWNRWIRPFVLRFLPEVRHMIGEQKRAHEWMRPLVDDFIRDSEGVGEEKPKTAKPGSRGAFISWMMKYIPGELRTAETIGNGQMLLSFAAIHTTSTTTTFALLDLLGHPQYVQPLREEIEQVIAEEGWQVDENGQKYLSKSSLSRLKKLDSFIKESQRMNPLNFGGSVRRVQRDYTFSNGVKLPAGTPITFPLWGVYQSQTTTTFSPEYNAETKNAPPTEFDGFRFSRLREVPGREMKHQAATTGPDAFNFGHGPNACPGRFFAVYMIKCIMVEFLLNYNMRLRPGVTRPPNMVKQLIVMPNPAAEVEIRRGVRA
ncbi:cytochrome p450 monooxygenase [Colletotrichum plurivorum]|uniref:Cytochrome p450 monooxygenase n=1 Tax=Colletotrichum plurivorum TaxID=2175906 RepID=A0A8H6JMS0_9PEZI|nr:cytochrome p450 monooxygenase [Colletotrichum plurivorum]